MAQVTIQRTEFRTHTFDIPDGIEEGSEEWNDIVNDYDWHNSSIEHANEEIISDKQFYYEEPFCMNLNPRFA